MSGVRAKAFTKTRACPSSAEISSRGLPRGKSDQIARHLSGCDFCAAEQSLLSADSQDTEEYEPAEMPAHLRRLAEALLVGRLKGSHQGSKFGMDLLPREQGFAFD